MNAPRIDHLTIHCQKFSRAGGKGREREHVGLPTVTDCVLAVLDAHELPESRRPGLPKGIQSNAKIPPPGCQELIRAFRDLCYEGEAFLIEAQQHNQQIT